MSVQRLNVFIMTSTFVGLPSSFPLHRGTPPLIPPVTRYPPSSSGLSFITCACSSSLKLFPNTSSRWDGISIGRVTSPEMKEKVRTARLYIRVIFFFFKLLKRSVQFSQWSSRRSVGYTCCQDFAPLRRAQTLLLIVLLFHGNTKSRIIVGKMAESIKRNDVLLPVLLRLPNELLLDIVPALSIADLRHLGRVSRRLYYFIGDYISRYRYNLGIFRLPSTILRRVARHLGNQKKRSHFARASQRFYPIVTRYIA
jgi:hypothetical protein